MALFQFGLGYTTAGVARQAQQQLQRPVISTARSPKKYLQITSQQHRVLLFNPASQQLLDAEGREALLQSCYVVSSIPPVASKLYDPVLQAQLKLLREACSSSDCQIQGLGYLSSTGVYGDWQGDWVDESSEPRTATGRGLLRLEAELAWAALAEQIGMPLTIFRLGGIYGPRRSVLDNLKAKANNPSSSAARRGRQRYTSRCHVADVVTSVLADVQRRSQQCSKATLQQTSSSSSSLVDIINVVDDEPAPRSDVEAYAHQLLHDSGGSTQEQQAVSGCGDDRRQRSKSSEPLEEKRVRNGKLKAVLQVELAAPSYREGLQMVHAGNTLPFLHSDLESIYNRY